MIFQLHSATKIYTEAMKNGYIERNVIKCLIIGAAGVGKTAIKHLLLRKDPTKESKSTGVMENPVRAVTFSRAMEKNGKEDDMWSIVNNDDELMMKIAEHLKTLQEEKKLDYEIHSTGNRSSHNTLNISSNDLESLQEQTNPSDGKIQSTCTELFHGQSTLKQEPENISDFSCRESIKRDGDEIENVNSSDSHDEESTDDAIHQRLIDAISKAKGICFYYFHSYYMYTVFYKWVWMHYIFYKLSCSIISSEPLNK